MSHSDQFPRLWTKRLLLREVIPEDRDVVLAYYSDPEVAKWFIDNPLEIAQQIDEIVDRFMARHKQGAGPTWAIVSRDTDELLGTCGYERVVIGGEAEIGFDLARAHWSRGIMTEALNAIIAYGFNQMALDTVVARTRSDNERAIRLLERLGFRGEAEPDGSWRFTLRRQTTE
jgi:ribosomal-protein-alanine N-acetyltransferase